MSFNRSQNILNYYKFCYDTTDPNAAPSAMTRDRRSAKQDRPSKARKGSLPDHSDDSRSRSLTEITTTESSTGCSTWTDTFSPEPKSLPIDPSDGNEGKISKPTESSERFNDNVQTLVVKLPPEKPSPSKDNTTFGLRRRSKSLESIVLTKKLEFSSNNNNNTSNGAVKKDKQNKTTYTLKSVFASLKNSTRFLIASSKPISSASVEPTPGTSEQSKLSDKTSTESEVEQSIIERVAAQSSRVTHSSKPTKRQAQSSNCKTQHKGSHEDHIYSSNNIRRSSPPPPAPPDPIVKVKSHIFYQAEDGKTYAEEIDEVCAGDGRRPPVKKVYFSNYSPNELEFSYNSEPTNIAGNPYSFGRLPHIDSEYPLRQFDPLNAESSIKTTNHQNLEGRYELQYSEENSFRPNQSYRRFPEVESDFERRHNAFHKQLLEDQVTEQHLIESPKRAPPFGVQKYRTEQYPKPESPSYKNNYNRPLRYNQRFEDDTFIQSSNDSIRCEPQHKYINPNKRQYFDQAGPCPLTNNYYEPRRHLSQTQDLRATQSTHTQNVQAGQHRSREINQPRERPSRTKSEPPNAERYLTHNKQTDKREQHTVKNKQTSEKYNYEIQPSEPGDRPANSFWRRDFTNRIELESPLPADHTGFTKVPILESSPSRRRYPLSPSEYLEEFENPYPEEPYFEDRNPPAHEFYPGRHMGRMGSLKEHERKVIIEFCHLLEKSKQLFNGLRELPQYGHKQWHSYFGRTFDVYTKLWKFQQQHRAILDSKYGLKRWQIGEIASKIGQLYYHFYLRTSDTAYLNEAFSFYYAIRGRSYYTKACKEDKCELIVKKLRYYARFIVVCLLLKKVKLVRELIKELDRQIIEYGNTYDPDDQIEWTVVVDEVKAFLQTEPIVSVIHPDNYPVLLSHRLSPLTTPPVERSQQMILSLQEVLIVGSSSQQVKFSELTMDMFRMLQTLEREPTGEIQHMYDDSPRQRFNLTPSALNNKGYNLETGAPRSENPHKYLLFKPTPNQILVYLASGCNDLPPNGALLLYISADGQTVQPSKHPEDGYDVGGLITTSKNDLYRDGNKDKSSQAKNRELQCFYPGDLYPFTRRPLFIIIDSDSSVVFQDIPRYFGQPMVVLMSPVEMPSGLHITQSERKQQGSLFTLFLHSPLTAICYCSDLHSVPLIHWDRAQAYIDTFLAEASQILTRGRIDPVFLNFMGDDFLRLLILRYMFCELVLRMHRAFRTRNHRPRSTPSLPDEIIEHPALVHIVFDLASHLQVRSSFQEPNGNPERTSKE